MAIEIRPITTDQTKAWFDALGTAFLMPFDADKIASEVNGLWDFDRVWGAFDGETIVGTFRSWATELTLPGLARIPATAVTMVGVRPSHRRRGVLSRMVVAEHDAARERGEKVALLYASEFPIYGRYGYGPATTQASWRLDTARTGFHGASTGSIEVGPPSTDARDAIRDVFEQWRVRQPGEIRRMNYNWDFWLGLRESAWGDKWKGFVCLHVDGDGRVDGYAWYHTEQKWEQGQPRSILQLDELHALDDDAYAALWRFLAEIDWVATIKAERRSLGERLPWLLTNQRAADASDIGDGLWLRLLDVPGALSERSYEHQAALVLEVVEGPVAGPPAARPIRVLLDASAEGATCSRTERSPDLTVHAAALGAAYLGSTRLRDAVIGSGFDEHRAGALAQADRLFATLDEPWCSTFF